MLRFMEQFKVFAHHFTPKSCSTIELILYVVFARLLCAIHRSDLSAARVAMSCHAKCRCRRRWRTVKLARHAEDSADMR